MKPPESVRGLRRRRLALAASRPVVAARRHALLWLSAAVVALLIVPTAGLALGTVSYFRFGSEQCEGLGFCNAAAPGAINNPNASAVNASGNGSGVNPGDVYVAGDGRIQQFTAAGDVVRLWGPAVTQSGPGNANEVQGVRVEGNAGSFKLGFGGATTADIPATATASAVESALEGLSSIGAGGVSVSGGPGDVNGASPYLVTFSGGSLGGVDQPLLKASPGSPPLSGGEATVTSYTAVEGGRGFEICNPSAGDDCGAAVNSFRGLAGYSSGGTFSDLAVDQATGNLYAITANRIEEYRADGQFLRAFGKDVVFAGPDDSAGADEQQRVTVKASGGTFSLGFRFRENEELPTTGPIPYNAPAATVESALNSLSSIGDLSGSVTVTEGPGSPSGSTPYLVVFHGALGGDDVPALISSTTGLTGAEKSATVEIDQDGGGFEVCEARDACKVGAQGTEGGSLGASVYNLAIAPSGSPNAGDVLISDAENSRVQEFTPTGAFVRAFGWDVDATEPSTGFEVCPAGHSCQRGTGGDGLGQFVRQFGSSLRSVGAAPDGSIYTVEAWNKFAEQGGRVQKFTPAGGLDLTPSLFGSSEVQELTVNAGAGQFQLTLFKEDKGTSGTGAVTAGSAVIANVQTSKGTFKVGSPITGEINNDGIEFGATILAIDESAHTITMSKPARFSNEFSHVLSDRFYTTPDLPFDAAASAVEAALNALPPINSLGGSVTVTEGPGDSTGSSPYQIHFDGGAIARTDLPQMTATSGSTPLSGGSGPSANTATVVTTTPGGPSGISRDRSPMELAVTEAGRLIVKKFYPLNFTKCADGSDSPSETRLQEIDSNGEVLATSDPCAGIPGFAETSSESKLTVNPITGHPYLLGGHFRQLDVYGPLGPSPALSLQAVSNIATTGGTIAGTIDPNGPGTEYPDVTGVPSSYRTTYRVEYKKASESSWTKYTPDLPLGSGTDPVPFSIGVGGLAPKTPYELKVVVVKPFTATIEEVKSFTTDPAPPEIESLSSSNVTAASADLEAKINPQGTDTTYHFEYGTTPAYGQSTPETGIGDSLQGQTVTDHIEGLQDTTYHFRVVATNSLGTTRSEDQTFNFHPQVCPNQTLRQQTGAAYLPDCRAYELVSPEDGGGSTLYPGGPQSPYASNPPRLAFVGGLVPIPNSGRSPINTTGDLYVATRDAEGWHTRYVGPSAEEAGCVGGRPLVSGTGPPATIQNDVMADPGLDRIIDWNLGNPMECISGWLSAIRFQDFNTAARGSNAPYVWNANGNFLDRWPTQVGDVTGSKENFDCPQDPTLHPYPPRFSSNVPVSYFCSTQVGASKDLNHFVFSTQSGLFGEGGITMAPGSAYDNDTANNTLKLISKLPGGGMIGQEPSGKAGPDELIQFPAISADGSHILMGTSVKPVCKQVDYPTSDLDVQDAYCPLVSQPTHLYMRVDNAVTYDVSAGKPVHYIGATPDGTRVYFTSDEQLTGDDDDESVDLFMWSESGGVPELTRLSRGDAGSAGNTDNCASTWTTDCDVETYVDTKITTDQGNQGGLGTWTQQNTNPGYTDNAIAASSGDIYFYSPEQLVAGKGAPGKENLYVYREGGLQLVAPLEDDPYCIKDFSGGVPIKTCSDGAAGRLQVTPNGRFAAFVTTSRITGYDNQGFAEMYRYDAEAETIQCVSCRQDGEPPTADVLASQGGRFITDDGRVFFNTAEALVPRDTNTGVDDNGQTAGTDVYEFIEGRPQLITSGTGTGARGDGSRSQPGLYGVSADGVDVYFGTYETLVGQDRNGSQLKFYDARTNGGFSFVPPPQPCAAADECHGPTAPVPAPLANGTGTNLVGGNATEAKPKKKARKHRKHKKRAQHKKAKAKRTAQRQKGGSR